MFSSPISSETYLMYLLKHFFLDNTFYNILPSISYAKFLSEMK